ncbi:uncharacterized protein LOC135924218 [Gordionus sp. m RMFG-2023]|uniref:uncharacterized protein LOC135924218 n=1 Tax=Gordionus sp. m RMFG-2023 TaxID=3053472 RepID=UPI0031FC6A40
MDQIFGDMDDVIFYTDDLLITGKNDEAHLNNIKKNIVNKEKLAWNLEHSKSFNDLKMLISLPPALTNFNPELPIGIATDASKCGLGAVLFHTENLDCLYKSNRIIIPSSMIKNILQSLHVGHLGAGKIKSLAKDYMWWPVTDNGTNFTSNDFEKFCNNFGIQHVLTSAYHQKSNGQVERMVRTFKTHMKRNIKIDLDIALGKFLFNYRNSRNDTTGVTPSQRMFNRDIRIKWDLLKPLDEKENKINVTLPRNRTFNDI